MLRTKALFIRFSVVFCRAMFECSFRTTKFNRDSLPDARSEKFRKNVLVKTQPDRDAANMSSVDWLSGVRRPPASTIDRLEQIITAKMIIFLNMY